MSNIAPTGFTPIYSYSNSALAQSGIVEFPYAAQYFHGFSGDVICQNFFAGNVGSSSNAQAPLGFCYPYPVYFQGNNFDATKINWCPILGVAVSFRYQPAGQNGMWVDSTNWVLGTPVEPNSTVWVRVQADIQNIFKVQISNSSAATTPYSITQNFLFSNNYLGSTSTYSVSLPEVTSGTVNPVNSLQFSLGDTTPNGVSIESLAVGTLGNNSFTPIEAKPFTIMGLTNGSIYQSSSIDNTDTNQWVTCRINWAWSQLSTFST